MRNTGFDCDFACVLLQGGRSKVGQGYKFSSVGSRFKKQLQELMDALHQMEPHYIRCIKPNSFNRWAHNHGRPTRNIFVTAQEMLAS